MLKILFAALISAAVLSGCAAPTQVSSPDPRVVEFRNYVSANRPRAEAGQIKWSDYYSGGYQRAVDANFPGEYLALLNQMIWNSQQFESGKISQEEFQFKQRDNSAQQRTLLQRTAEAEQIQQQARTMQAVQLMQAMQPKPLTLAPLPAIAPSPSTPSTINQGVSAFWTGKQQQVQTVTNQFGWTCEYNYAGRTFWRTFVGTCPSSVQVQ